MAIPVYRDQIERFYELEALEYSKRDIASLCDISDSLVSVWRSVTPHPEDFAPRPPLAPLLPQMRDKTPITGRAGGLAMMATTKRAVRPPPREPAPEAAPEAPPDPAPEIELPRTYKPRKPKFIIAEKRPPGGKEAAKKAGAVGPVTRGQLTHAVDKALKAQRAEILKEIKAAGFDPTVTWNTEVDETAFNPIKALVQLAHVPNCPEHTILGVLRELIRLRKERAKIAWDTVKLDDIPVEYRPRLAGQLAEWLEVAELPVEVQEHEVVREVYELTGVALPKPAEAEAFLLRWEQTLEDMRTDAEARTVAEKARGVLVMDGPPKVAAEFRVRPSTGAGST